MHLAGVGLVGLALLLVLAPGAVPAVPMAVAWALLIVVVLAGVVTLDLVAA